MGGGGIKGNPVGLARFKATPVLKKEVANFNSPVERVRGTYRRQGGQGACVLLRGRRKSAAGAAVTARPPTRCPQTPVKGRGRCKGRRRRRRRRLNRARGAGWGEESRLPTAAESSARARVLPVPNAATRRDGDGPAGAGAAWSDAIPAQAFLTSLAFPQGKRALKTWGFWVWFFFFFPPRSVAK